MNQRCTCPKIFTALLVSVKTIVIFYTDSKSYVTRSFVASSKDPLFVCMTRESRKADPPKAPRLSRDAPKFTGNYWYGSVCLSKNARIIITVSDVMVDFVCYRADWPSDRTVNV